jgi:hypothetical protein
LIAFVVVWQALIAKEYVWLCCLRDLQNQGDGAWKQAAPLQLNCGGCIIDLKRSTIMVASNSMLARIVSGRWDHVPAVVYTPVIGSSPVASSDFHVDDVTITFMETR